MGNGGAGGTSCYRTVKTSCNGTNSNRPKWFTG